jgi:hypothetical protein
MPVNFQEIQNKIKEMGQQAKGIQQDLQDQRMKAFRLLNSKADCLDELKERVAKAADGNPNLRCAVPFDEPLTFTQPVPSLPPGLTILAADGSQINPDRHDAAEFSVINVGAICLQPGKVPVEITHSQLFYGDSLRTSTGRPLTEEIVALRRDLNERRLLADEAEKASPPVVTLTDGPLELFRQPGNDPDLEGPFKEYIEVLKRLAYKKVVTAGYVDKPSANLVVRLLELADMPVDALTHVERTGSLNRVSDYYLFQNLLAPGERSAVFAIQSSSKRDFTGALELHFFYLNVGRVEHPWLVRVEVPFWVVKDCDLLYPLHATLVSQCRQMGSHAYPYVLHRAHEVALVTLEEKQQILDMIAAEMYRQGVEVGEKSQKQAVKDLSTARTRYPK